MTALERLLIYRQELLQIETELTVMELTVMGTQRVTNDAVPEPYALQSFNGWVN